MHCSTALGIFFSWLISVIRQFDFWWWLLQWLTCYEEHLTEVSVELWQVTHMMAILVLQAAAAAAKAADSELEAAEEAIGSYAATACRDVDVSQDNVEHIHADSGVGSAQTDDLIANSMMSTSVSISRPLLMTLPGIVLWNGAQGKWQDCYYYIYSRNENSPLVKLSKVPSTGATAAHRVVCRTAESFKHKPLA